MRMRSFDPNLRRMVLGQNDQAQARQTIKEAKRQIILPPPPGLTFHRDQVEVLDLHEAAVITANSNKRFIHTFALSFCLGISLADSNNQVASLGHFTPSTFAWQSLNIMIYAMKRHGADPNNLIANIMGGRNEHSESILEESVAFLNDGKIPIVNLDIFREGKNCAPIIDSTGKIYDLSNNIIKRIPGPNELPINCLPTECEVDMIYEPAMD